MNIIDTIRVYLYRCIESATRLGKVDTSFIIPTLHLSSCHEILSSIIAWTTISIVTVAAIFREELIHILNELESPTVPGIDFILCIHSNSLAVDLA